MTSQTWRLFQSRQGIVGMTLFLALTIIFLYVYYGPSNNGVVSFWVPQEALPPNPGYQDSSPRHPTTPEEIRQRFEARRQRVKTFCSRPDYRKPDGGVDFSDFRYGFAAFRRLRWCRVAKVGTTFIKSKFFPQTKLQSRNLSKTTLNYLTKHPKTFYFVRDPYSRLVSGFFDKVMTAPNRWQDIGALVIRTQRPNAREEEIECGSDATFLEFFRYVIWAETTNRTRNIHFMPMHDLCDVCNKDFDFIGHLETIKEDLPYIVDSVGVTMDTNINITREIAHRMSSIFRVKRSLVKRCLGVYPMMQRVWWFFQARGVIADSIPLAASRAQVQAASTSQLTSWVLQAHHSTHALGSRSAQKRKFLVALFRQIPLSLRLRFVELYSRDFELFQYDPLPHDLYPELYDGVE
ncbi:hypothetical protein EGW08_010779 [Elysia chlorotica]|uniref:Carbohydrate sulfotransferase n=1 Tax=Elysia chlorotica TaxID=188477 RepID=A0A3S1HKP7_ELYCH|nr:hypothetical protein EGW08_010779 [Elysia chlorotica]